MNDVLYNKHIVAQKLSDKEFTQHIFQFLFIDSKIIVHANLYLVSGHTDPGTYHERTAVLYDLWGTPGESLWRPQQSSGRQESQTSTLRRPITQNVTSLQRWALGLQYIAC